MRVLPRIAGCVLGGWLLWAGCDSAPGPAPADREPPVVAAFSYAPQVVDLETLPPDQLVEGRVRVPVDLAATVRDADGTVGQVRYLVKAPGQATTVMAEGILTRADGDRYTSRFTLDVPVAEVGSYTITVFAVDDDAQLSNQAIGTVTLVATGEPPVIEEVIADPETLTPPGDLTLIAVVSDPDGLQNIVRVTGRAPAGFTFELADDGQTFGDAEAGDGRYTVTFNVPSASPGVQTFSFQAFDRSGQASEVVTKDVTITE